MITGLPALICMLFVGFLLRLDRKEFPEASRALWLPSVWMLIAASRALGLWLGSGVEAEEAGSFYDRAFQIGALAIGLIILKRRQFRWLRAIRQNKVIMVLVGYMLVSVLWSDIPFTSFKRWVREFVAVTMAFMVATEVKPHAALEAVLRRTIYILIPFSLSIIQYYPKVGTHYMAWADEIMWLGVAGHKNGLGRLCLFAMLILAWRIGRRWYGGVSVSVPYLIHIEVALFAIALYLFMGPKHSIVYSATSAVSLAAGFGLLGYLSWLKWRKRAIGENVLMLMFGAVFIYAVVTPFAGRLSIIDLSSFLGRSETLTGRASNWEVLVPYAMETAICGLGFGAYAKEMTPHNGPLMVILNLGFVGLFLFAMFLLSSVRRARRAMNKDFGWGAIWVCLLFSACLHNVAESTIASFGGHLAATLLFFYISATPCNYSGDCEEKGAPGRKRVAF